MWFGIAGSYLAEVVLHTTRAVRIHQHARQNFAEHHKLRVVPSAKVPNCILPSASIGYAMNVQEFLASHRQHTNKFVAKGIE